MPLRQQLASGLREKSRTTDFWLHLFLFACLALAFWPMTRWVAATAHDQSRLLHALVVLALATAFLIRFGGVGVTQTLRLNRLSRRSLLLSYGLLLLGFAAQFLNPPGRGLLGWTLASTSIAAYCSGIAAFVFFVFGENCRRIVLTVVTTFGAFLLISLSMDGLDWPLRTLAGQWSGALLELLGKQVELGLIRPEEGPPKLILLVDKHPFHVASECNGFGVILTSLLIALLLSLYRKTGPAGMALNLFVGISLGLAFNLLRIVVIVLLAPALMDHYMLMHEIVGGITYWACLALIWVLLKGPMPE
ncbi:MAG: archaeosortase/exosortase family protein [Verrucomicrobiota bacterium]